MPCSLRVKQPVLRARDTDAWSVLAGTVPSMRGIETDPKNNPEYLTLSQASKECGVNVPALQELVRARKIVSGIARTKNGHVYLHRDHVPSWSQVEEILIEMHRQRLEQIDSIVTRLEKEVEAVRMDLNEAFDDPDAALGDDLLAAGAGGRNAPRTLSSAVDDLQSEVLALTFIKRHLSEVRLRV